jgi:NADPH:quinone reductase-like Zn-dependent oxidoreductase
MEKMKAVICTKYGPPEVLQIKEVEKPAPKDKEIQIKVHATTVNAADCNVRGLVYIPTGLGLLAKLMLGFNKPKIQVIGSVLAGEITAIGKNVKSFKPGDHVFGTGPELGAYAEYACRPEEGAIAHKPQNISFEQAAAVPYGALTALYFLRDIAKIKSGQKILIKGASGGVGVYAVQLSHYFGAEVTGVCSTANLEFVKSLGADKVIDYTREDYTQSNEKWDIILDIVVGKTSFLRNKKSLNPKGYYIAVAGGIYDLIQMILTSITGGKKVIFGGGTACERKENLIFIKELIEAGKLIPVVDRNFAFEQIIDAHKYVEAGHKKGNISISVL